MKKKIEKSYDSIYIVNWKDTVLGEDNVLETECGTCEVAYKDENDAIKQVKELVKAQVKECINELGYEKEDVSKQVGGDYGCVTAGSNTYEFNVAEVIVDK